MRTPAVVLIAVALLPFVVACDKVADVDDSGSGTTERAEPIRAGDADGRILYYVDGNRLLRAGHRSPLYTLDGTTVRVGDRRGAPKWVVEGNRVSTAGTDGEQILHFDGTLIRRRDRRGEALYTIQGPTVRKIATGERLLYFEGAVHRWAVLAALAADLEADGIGVDPVQPVPEGELVRAEDADGEILYAVRGGAFYVAGRDEPLFVREGDSIQRPDGRTVWHLDKHRVRRREATGEVVAVFDSGFLRRPGRNGERLFYLDGKTIRRGGRRGEPVLFFEGPVRRWALICAIRADL